MTITKLTITVRLGQKHHYKDSPQHDMIEQIRVLELVHRERKGPIEKPSLELITLNRRVCSIYSQCRSDPFIEEYTIGLGLSTASMAVLRSGQSDRTP